MKKILTHWTIAFVTLFVLMYIGFKDPQVKEIIRLKGFDLLLQSEERIQSQNIGIVTIDEKSIEKYGQWPWKRTVIADMIWQLREAGAGIIILPILFSEQDRLGGDMDLAQAIAGNGVVIAQTGTSQTNKNAVPRGVAKIGDPLPWLFEWDGMLGPIELLGLNADGVGVISTVPEIDGVVRRLPLLMRVGEDIFPSIAMETIRVATGDPSYQVKTQEGGITAMRVPSYPTIKTDSFGRIWLRYNKDFETMSATDEDFFWTLEGKIVMIAPTAEGIGSIIATPTGEQYSYVPNAVSLQGILNGETLVRFPESTFLEWLSAIGLGLLLILVANRGPYWLSGIMIVAIPVGAVYGSYYYFMNYLWLIDWSWVVIVTTIVGFHAIFNRFVKEFFEKQAIKKQFAGYCSPTIVKMLQENPAMIKDGMKREISICFSDLRGFTPLGESFGDDVKGLTKLMNGYMDAITQPVLDADGMIIKYIGDASMHIHNAPLDDEYHPMTAVQCGLDMLKAVEKFNEKITKDGKPAIGMGAGINTGLGYLGEMGSTKRHSYDVLGDAVSTAARIESKCKEYGCLLLVGENTYDATKEDFFYLKVDELAVKGKTVGIRIYTVIDDHCDSDAQLKHELMQRCYTEMKFDKSIRLCKELTGEFGGQIDKYYEMWIERCEYMKTQDLPDNWNGVFIATTK